ncbi:MAG TPA: CHAP domain-containing protein [Candidatus Acidoferrales bacterium]|nr:CHAP domain-containing protein [Candidatus Acidoferrales bacterium]HVB76424.1 CHAP domain-containing protein [Candidatus Nitrosotalea sp.]
MLVLAIVLSGYVSLNRQLPSELSLRLGSVNAQGLMMSQGGQTGAVQMGRLGTIVKPIAMPTVAAVSHDAIKYQVQSGDTLASLAGRFNVSEDSIRWSNYSLLKNVTADVGVGNSLIIPPVDGVAVVTQAGNTIEQLSSTYHGDVNAVMDFNYIRSQSSQPLTSGEVIVVPGGHGPALFHPLPQVAVGSTLPQVAVGSTGASTVIQTVSPLVNHAARGNTFPYGQCTWYVYNKRPVPWIGNAYQWFGNAKAYGWSTGMTPRAGAIMVTWESSLGHVAYVESVNPNGSWVVSEMNYKGPGIVDYRTISPGGVPLIGFIY